MLNRLAIRDEKQADAVFRWLVWVVVLLALWLRTLHMGDVASRSPDESVYSGSALRLALEGPAAYRQIFAEYVADPGRWIYPSPTRVVPVVLFAGVMKLTGSSSAQAGAAVSWGLGIASVWLLAWFGRRFFGRVVGLVAALFLATYVPELEFARRAWGESTAAFFTLALVYAGCALDAEPERWRRWFAFFATGTVCLLVKETGIFAYALCGVWLVFRRLVAARDLRSAALLTGGGLASLLAAFGVLVLLAGSMDRAAFGLRQVFGNGLGSNDWGAQYASGPWYQFGHLLGALAPLTALMALAGVLVVTIPHLAARGLLEPGARAPARLAVLLTLGFVAACAFGPNLQYLRIMAPANPSYCLLAGLGVWALGVACEWGLRPMAHPALAAIASVLFVTAAVRDHGVYADVVVRSGMQDLAVRWLLDGIARRGQRSGETSPTPIPTPLPSQPSADNGLVSSSPPRPGSPADSPRNAPAAKPGVVTDTASQLVARSLEHCRREQWTECVTTARAASRLEPLRAEAWNNAAVGYAGLQLWDDAERCARRALELQPDFQLARNNLAWVSEEKAKRMASIQTP
jgi:4-amino-4-deoxy-L-arabinose transferase-like glycosyltransferase